MGSTTKVPFEVEAMAAVFDRPCHTGGNGRIFGDEKRFGMFFLHCPVHRLHETKSFRVVAIAVLAQKCLILLLRGKLIIVKLSSSIEPKAIDIKLFDPVKQ